MLNSADEVKQSQFYETDKTISSERKQGSAPKVRIVFTAAAAINFSGCVTESVKMCPTL